MGHYTTGWQGQVEYAALILRPASKLPYETRDSVTAYSTLCWFLPPFVAVQHLLKHSSLHIIVSVQASCIHKSFDTQVRIAPVFLFQYGN